MDMIECPNCKHLVPAGATFCDQCGLALADGFRGGASVSPRLIIRSNDNVVVALPSDLSEYLIGRKDPATGIFPDVDLVPFGGEEGGVSRRHARITHLNGQFFVEDLNSVNYTFVNRQKIEPGTRHLIRDGDEIRLGRIILVFRTD